MTTACRTPNCAEVSLVTRRAGLGRSQPQIAPPAPVAGRASQSVAGIDARRSADSRRAEPTPQTQLLTEKKRSENPTEARTNPNATDYTLEVRLLDFGVAIPTSLDRNRRDHDVHAITRGEIFIADPGRATGGRGWTRPTEPQAERSRAQRSGPDLPWPFRAISGLRRNRVASDAATRRPARPCSRCRQRPFFGRGCLP